MDHFCIHVSERVYHRSSFFLDTKHTHCSYGLRTLTDIRCRIDLHYTDFQMFTFGAAPPPKHSTAHHFGDQSHTLRLSLVFIRYFIRYLLLTVLNVDRLTPSEIYYSLNSVCYNFFLHQLSLN